jgi:hypothetical protein
MFCTLYVRHSATFATKTARLRCDGCKAETRPRHVMPNDSDDDWIRIDLPSDGWTRRLDGRILKDYCPACSVSTN